VILPDFAFAQVGNGSTAYTQGYSIVGAGLCAFAEAFEGEIAAAIATIAVCTIGVMACVGRIQWTTAIVVAIGIAVIFGSAVLISLFTNQLRGGVQDADCFAVQTWSVAR